MDSKDYIVSTKITIRDAIKAIDTSGKKVVLVVGEDKKLFGILTDGDVRKYILQNKSIDASICDAVNKNPKTFRSRKEAKKDVDFQGLIVYPIVNEKNNLIDVIFWNDMKEKSVISTALRDIPVVIMAGGKGTRLYPYTKILPKPLIPIGDMTISERIIEKFKKFGANEYTFILNHKANMIKAYFNDLDKDYTVKYKQEEEFLGTGGGISLLRDDIKSTFFLSNCDVIIDDDFECIYKFHKSQGNLITFVCAMKTLTIPYGVIDIADDGKMKSLVEKPSYSFLTSTGLYVIEPEIFEEIEENKFIHITDIATKYIKDGKKVGVYPISENNWFDMGEFEEMENMLKFLGVE